VTRALVFVLMGAAAAGQAPSRRCQGEIYAALDFWVGRWDVRLQNGTLAGTDVVEKTLDGCVVLEHWTDVSGVTGESLFYYHPVASVWKQVWVTPPGAVKEKQMVPAPRADSVRFEGHAFRPDGVSVPDRTTLIKHADGTVRQIIEQSRDGGGTWETLFDAIYTAR
jgi:hypothetical protein